MMEPALLEPLTWEECVWLAGFIVVWVLIDFVIWQFIKIIWRKEN